MSVDNESDVRVRLPALFSLGLRYSEMFRSVVVVYGRLGRNFALEDGTDCAVFTFKNGTDYLTFASPCIIIRFK